ncbi:Uncharacterized [Syntrophomonas zehnderi OL-4]|uniref:Uncharacterized n=1 Tax=Syntrophomonas zehnderi OL-4 TaxID=690567 RepID=A0A0E3W3L8_9FIRM|nr:hypothetical protein [Syntrophomonas zehnderi]CFX91805.1 Uncharacterized [Syntrophomonas zehnderi OL-4]
MQVNLYANGILLPSGDISRDKINLITGAMTAPFVETLWAFSENDTEVMKRISAIFTHLYSEGREVEMLAGHPEARQYFLFSFLLDMDDIMQDFMAEAGRAFCSP